MERGVYQERTQEIISGGGRGGAACRTRTFVSIIPFILYYSLFQILIVRTVHVQCISNRLIKP